MNFLPGVSWVKILVYVGIVLALIGFGARMEHNRMQKKLDAVTNEYNQFKGGVAALGHAAEIAVAKQKLADIKAKERADEERKTRTARVGADVKRVRDANDAGSGRVYTAPAGSGCPETQVCFDAGEFRAASGKRREGIRGLATEGAQIEIDLNVAREWANP